MEIPPGDEVLELRFRESASEPAETPRLLPLKDGRREPTATPAPVVVDVGRDPSVVVYSYLSRPATHFRQDMNLDVFVSVWRLRNFTLPLYANKKGKLTHHADLMRTLRSAVNMHSLTEGRVNTRC